MQRAVWTAVVRPRAQRPDSFLLFISSQVFWQSTGRTYWVHWHMLEILGPEEATGESAAATVGKGAGATVLSTGEPRTGCQQFVWNRGTLPGTKPFRAAAPPEVRKLTLPVSSACPSWDWKPAHGLYSLPYLQPEPQKNEEPGCLTQAEWWELLFFIKKLDLCEQQPIFQNLHEKLDKVAEV